MSEYASGSRDAGTVPHVLDNPALASLTGPHAHFAERRGRVLRYPLDVSPWLGLPDEPDADDWADLAVLAGPGAEVPVPAYTGAVPGRLGGDLRPGGRAARRRRDRRAPPTTRPYASAPPTCPRCSTSSSAPSPAPSCPAPSNSAPTSASAGTAPSSPWPASGCTRRAGPRSARSAPTPPSAAPGLATRLIHAVAHGIRERGETPFLHTSATNTTAIRLYESLGFRLRRTTRFMAARVPLVEAGEERVGVQRVVVTAAASRPPGRTAPGFPARALEGGRDHGVGLPGQSARGPRR